MKRVEDSRGCSQRFARDRFRAIWQPISFGIVLECENQCVRAFPIAMDVKNGGYLTVGVQLAQELEHAMIVVRTNIDSLACRQVPYCARMRDRSLEHRIVIRRGYATNRKLH